MVLGYSSLSIIGVFVFITVPPPPPPKIVLRSSSRDAEKNGENTERDSGLWTGESAYDTVTEWTKHHTQPLPGSLVTG